MQAMPPAGTKKTYFSFITKHLSFQARPYLSFRANRLCRNCITEHLSSLLSQQNHKTCLLPGNIKPFSQTSVKISAVSLRYSDFRAIHHPPSLVIKPATPTMLIILAILKQLDKIEASALTPARPRNKKPLTFKLCFIWPNGSSTFCLRSV